jgi:aryl-alcohol dehydrogenase-like predicted oxidoreductase
MGYRRFEELVRGAYDRGVRTFDMADMYGTHGFFTWATKGLPRDSYSIITKIWFRGGGIPEPEREDPAVLVERFLRELQTDHIDLLLLHCVVSPEWNVELRKQMDSMSRLKERGLVKANGVSCHRLEALKACIDEPWVDSVHARINPYGEKMDGPPEEVVPVLKAIHGAGKGVVGMKIIGEGSFRNSDEQRDNSISFALNLGCVDVLNVGFENLDEVDDFAARVRRAKRTVSEG